MGDFVAVDPNLYCGHCQYCRMGRENLCENYSAIGVTRDGACAEYVQVPSASAFVLPEEMPRRWGTLVEPLACAVHGLDRAGPALGASYLIYGAGTMGLLLAQLARHAGAGRVDVVDRNSERLALAARLAADRAAESAAAFDPLGGWEVVIDATGAVPAIEDGIRRVKRGGTFLMFGVARADAGATISPFRIYNDEIRIVGSMAIHHSFERAVQVLAKGAIDCKAMITHLYPLESYGTAIETFVSGEGLKIQVASSASRDDGPGNGQRD
jgi:2-desacetyl-2-hydroxyethyl bacteriochlorophyllide A dehydrogenase